MWACKTTHTNTRTLDDYIELVIELLASLLQFSALDLPLGVVASIFISNEFMFRDTAPHTPGERIRELVDDVDEQSPLRPAHTACMR